MSNLTATSYLHLLETCRDEKKIYVTVVFANGEAGHQLNWSDKFQMSGYIEALPKLDGSYDLTIALQDKGGVKSLTLNCQVNFLPDDQAFLGSVNNSVDGLQFFADQEGGYPLYIYNGGKDYTAELYNRLVGYNEWAINNGYPQVERSLISAKSICQAFPLVVNHKLA